MHINRSDNMEKWARIKYQPCLPLGDNESRITGCEKHIALSREAAREGMVLLKMKIILCRLKREAGLQSLVKRRLIMLKVVEAAGIFFVNMLEIFMKDCR